MKRLSLAPLAIKDLRKIAAHISKNRPARARSFAAELKRKAEQAAERPQAHRARLDLGPDVRSIAHGRYLILFRDLPEQVVILRFWHSAQDLADLTCD